MKDQQGRHVAPIDREEFDYIYDIGRYQGLIACACFILMILSFMLAFVNCRFG